MYGLESFAWTGQNKDWMTLGKWMAANKATLLAEAAAAIEDPVGARVAILDYGAMRGWPDIKAGPMQLKGGEAGWRQVVALAQPLWLGVAWHWIEIREQEWQFDQEDKRQAAILAEQANKGKEVTPVAVLQWTESGKGLDAGDYPAIITEIEETTGEYGPQFQFQFVILDKDGEQTDDEIRGWCSQKWGEKTKLYKWSKAILGKRCPAPGQPMDTDRLINKKCDLRVEVTAGDAGPRSKISEVYPYQTVSKNDESDDDTPF